MAGAISDQTTDLSNVSLTGNFQSSRVSSAGTTIAGEGWFGTSGISVQGSVRVSGVTADLRTNLVRLSYATEANVSGLTTGMLGIVFAASGISLIYSSGKSVYVVGQSAQSAAGA